VKISANNVLNHQAIVYNVRLTQIELSAFLIVLAKMAILMMGLIHFVKVI